MAGEDLIFATRTYAQGTDQKVAERSEPLLLGKISPLIVGAPSYLRSDNTELGSWLACASIAVPACWIICLAAKSDVVFA
jgi:hypothetical protein